MDECTGIWSEIMCMRREVLMFPSNTEYVTKKNLVFLETQGQLLSSVNSKIFCKIWDFIRS